MAANYWQVFGWAALLILSGNGAGGYAASETVDSASAHITVLYDAFGETSAMQKDWGYAALSNTAASAFCSIPGTTRVSSRRMQRQEESIFLNWISWSCRTATGITSEDWATS